MVPEGWVKTKLGGLGKIKSGATPLRSEGSRYFAESGYPWVKTMDLNNGEIYFTRECITETALEETSCSLFPEGTVLVAMYGGFNQIGRTGILTRLAAINQAISAIQLDKNKAHPNYVLAFLNGHVNKWKRFAASSRKDPNITRDDVLRFPISLPPLPEQKKIAAILFTWDEAISANEDLLANSRLRKKALMQQLLTGKRRLPGFEREWLSTRLGDECSLVTKGTTPSSMGMGFTEKGVSFLKVESLGANGEILAKQTAFISHETHESLKRSQLYEADLLISIAGALGRTAIVPLRVLPANTNQALAIVRLSPNSSIDLGFLYHSIRSDRIQKHFSEISSQGAQANLSLQQISNIQVWAPEIKEQKAIAELLSVADEETHALEQRISNLKLQKKALMQQLLTGKKRVKVESVTA